jgi:hypothetical protein
VDTAGPVDLAAIADWACRMSQAGASGPTGTG